MRKTYLISVESSSKSSIPISTLETILASLGMAQKKNTRLVSLPVEADPDRVIKVLEKEGIVVGNALRLNLG